MEDALVDGDEDEAEVVVEGPFEGVGGSRCVVGEARRAGSLLQEAGPDQRVDRRPLKGVGEVVAGPQDQPSARENQ